MFDRTEGLLREAESRTDPAYAAYIDSLTPEAQQRLFEQQIREDRLWPVRVLLWLVRAPFRFAWWVLLLPFKLLRARRR